MGIPLDKITDPKLRARIKALDEIQKRVNPNPESEPPPAVAEKPWVPSPWPPRPPRKQGPTWTVVFIWMEEMGIPKPIAEFRFHPERLWRFDYAWPEVMIGRTPTPTKLALEVQGGIWTGGRHVRGAALVQEMEKLNAAAELGYRVIFVQPRDLCTAATATLIRRCLHMPI